MIKKIRETKGRIKALQMRLGALYKEDKKERDRINKGRRKK